jgi:large subunit ribosomal protein L20
MSSLSNYGRTLFYVNSAIPAVVAPTVLHNPILLPTNTTSTLQSRSFASQKHKRIIKMAKGYRGRANRTYRAAIRRVEKGLQYSYRDRKVKKRNFRRLWIERVNAGVRQHGMSYSRFIRGLQRVGKKKHGEGKEGEDEKQEGILLNRKVLADLAANEPFSFKAVVDVVKMKMGQLTGGSK